MEIALLAAALLAMLVPPGPAPAVGRPGGRRIGRAGHHRHPVVGRRRDVRPSSRAARLPDLRRPAGGAARPARAVQPPSPHSSTAAAHLVAWLWVLAAAVTALLNLDAAVVLLTPLYIQHRPAPPPRRRGPGVPAGPPRLPRVEPAAGVQPHQPDRRRAHRPRRRDFLAHLAGPTRGRLRRRMDLPTAGASTSNRRPRPGTTSRWTGAAIRRGAADRGVRRDRLHRSATSSASRPGASPGSRRSGPRSASGAGRGGWCRSRPSWSPLAHRPRARRDTAPPPRRPPRRRRPERSRRALVFGSVGVGRDEQPAGGHRRTPRTRRGRPGVAVADRCQHGPGARHHRRRCPASCGATPADAWASTSAPGATRPSACASGSLPSSSPAAIVVLA